MGDTVEKIKTSKRKLTEEELTQMAIEELNREMVKAKARAELNPYAQRADCPLKRTNKRFLTNTLKSALNFNNRKGVSSRIKSMEKLVEVEERVENPQSASKPKKFGHRQHVFKKSKRKRTSSSSSSHPLPAQVHFNPPEEDSGPSSSSSDVIIL